MTRTATAVLIIICSSLSTALPARGENPLQAGWGRIKATTQKVRARLLDTPTGQAVQRTTKRLGRCCRKLSGGVTLGADRLEQALPPRASQVVRRTRDFNPLALSGYFTRKIKKDPAILGYGVASTVYTSVKEASMLKRGVSPLSVATFEAATTALDVGVVLLREHHKGQDSTFKETLRRVGREFRGYASSTRKANRRYMRRLKALERKIARRSSK